MQEAINFLFDFNETLEVIFRNSGKDYNDLGRFEDCSNYTDFSYILASVPNAFPIPMSVGMCVPAICTISDYNNLKPSIVASINEAIPDLFKGVKGFNLDEKLNTDDLQFFDSQKLNKQITKFDAGNFIIIMIIVVFTLSVIICSFLLWYYKQEKKRIKEGRTSRTSSKSGQRSRRKEGVVVKNGNASSSDNQISENDDSSERQVSSGKKRRKPRVKKWGERLIKTMAIQSNVHILFKRRSGEGDHELEALNGVRVLTLAVIILGNTYFYILKGPLQNLNIIQEWMENALFSVVISAELAVDIFFWLTAFLSSYYLLNRMDERDGSMGKVYKIYLTRLLRLWPLYFFTLFFFWKFLVLFGGDGPMFFMYETMTHCGKSWYWHLLFLNNLIPWRTVDTCMNWTWYLANDMQFFLLVPFFVSLYYQRRKFFFIAMASITFCSVIIQTAIILANHLSVSYFTYKDEYWTIYYVKPWARIPAFLIGVFVGCTYYTYKKEEEELHGKAARLIAQIKDSKLMTVAAGIVGTTLMMLMVLLMQLFNNSPNEVPQVWNLFYLLLSRPLFMIGFTMNIIPILAGSKFSRPFYKFLSHQFFVPFARLSYGAYLSHGVFMQYRMYNSEKGYWGCGLDAFLFFFAFITFSYTFSFFTYIFIEAPFQNICKEFIFKKKNYTEVYFHSQSAKSVKREKKDNNEEEDTTVDESEKKQKRKRSSSKKDKRDRKQSIEAEDLEDHKEVDPSEDDLQSSSIFEQERRQLQYRDKDSGIN